MKATYIAMGVNGFKMDRKEFSYYTPEIKKCLSNHFKIFGFYPKYIRLYRISGIPCDLSVKHIKGFLDG